MTGHLQIEIPVTITEIKDDVSVTKTVVKKVGLKYGMYAAEMLGKIKGESLSSANIVKMIWAGYLNNCFAKQVDEELTFEDVSDWVENLTLNGDSEGILLKIAQTFSESEPIKKLIENAEKLKDEDSKKKLEETSQQTGGLFAA